MIDPLDSDSDDDGFSDREEITAGTDPNDPNYFPDTGTDDPNGSSGIPGFSVALIGLISIISVIMLLKLTKKARIH